MIIMIIPITDPAMLLFLLMVGHALADYPLQGDFLATAKDHHTEIGAIFWFHALTAHSLIHAGFVAVLTGSVWLGASEFFAHWMTDRLKCKRVIGLNTDQAIHILCKVVWWLVALCA